MAQTVPYLVRRSITWSMVAAFRTVLCVNPGEPVKRLPILIASALTVGPAVVLALAELIGRSTDAPAPSYSKDALVYLLAYWVVLAFVFAGAFAVRLFKRLSYLNRRTELCSMLAEGCHLRGEAIRFAHAYWAKFGDGAGFMDSEQARLGLLQWNQRVDVLMQGADTALQKLGKAETARISAKFPYVNGEAWLDDRVNYADHLCTKLARLLHEEEREQETRHTAKKPDAPRLGSAHRASVDEFSAG